MFLACSTGLDFEEFKMLLGMIADVDFPDDPTGYDQVSQALVECHDNINEKGIFVRFAYFRDLRWKRRHASKMRMMKALQE
jgi:hypothetical protein